MNFRILLIVPLIGLAACNPGNSNNGSKESPSDQELSFSSRQLVSNAQYWWAVTIGDVSNDGLQDIVFIDNNSSGGYLGYYKGQTEQGPWEMVKIADKSPYGEDFASGDLETGDMDGDGDQDIIAVEHTGEWDDAGAPAKLFWYQNPEWKAFPIGGVPDAVKDLSIADFNQDGKPDLAVLTFDENTISVFQQNEGGTFEKVLFQVVKNLHEGMDVGDADGDGYPDIFATGYCFINPGGELTKEWIIESVDTKWHDQTGDWSQNATKQFCADLDKDGKTEVFMSHSERNGYPVAWYKRSEDGWEEHIVADSLSSCHTLQVFDFDLDGDLDVFAGVNVHRAVNIGKTEFPLNIYLNDGTNLSWTLLNLQNDGIYNGRVADFEGDGDFDIFRLPGHAAEEYFILENKIK